MKTRLMIIGILFGLAVGACSNQTDLDTPNSEKISEDKAVDTEPFQQKVLREKITDANSPLGYWEVDLSYPQLNDNPNIASSVINKSIESLVNRYQCDAGGDKSFTGEIIQIDEDVVVISYESMWMCATMPHPDSESNVVTFNIKTGEQLQNSK